MTAPPITPARPVVVGRFHGFLLLVVLAVSITAFVKVPAGFALPMHWGLHGQPDWLWPKEQSLLVAPIVGVALLGVFALIGRVSTRAQLEAGAHVLRVMLAGLLGLLAAIQFGLLMIGIGSDIDVIRMLGGAMALFLFVLGNELRGAQPQPYAGLRLPWTPKTPRAWGIAHQLTGALLMAGGLALGLCVWLWPDAGTLIAVLVGAIVVPVAAGGVASLVLR